ISQGPRVCIRSKATCAAPLCEVLTPCRGLRPHHVQKDRIGNGNMNMEARESPIMDPIRRKVLASGAAATAMAAAPQVFAQPTGPGGTGEGATCGLVIFCPMKRDIRARQYEKG